MLNYNLIFTGSFFDTADFIAGIDKLITLRDNNEAVANGRLLTIDGFSMTADPDLGFPKLKATFVVTAYSAPSSQGLTLGQLRARPHRKPPRPARRCRHEGLEGEKLGEDVI